MTDSGPAQWTHFRDIPLEVLRDFVRTRAEDTSIRQVAIDMGLGRTTLHSFIGAQTSPHPRVRRKIALSYLNWLQAAPDMDLVRPYAAALGVLTEGMPERQREGAVEIVLDGLELGFCGDGESPPRWLEALRVVTRRSA
ncbi:hypothetical protein [Longimicrobium sp.]|uniref:hypothetical protein n=1 Tax=Longimicrobium sp. TaxID=2029185 RepID=UPI003B3B52F4